MIKTAHLFLPLHNKLIELLRSLDAADWNKPTLAKQWTVKDIASHLLDGSIRTLSISRDKHTLVPDRPIDSYQTLVDYLNKLNADWVIATKRLSLPVLIELIDSTGKQQAAFFESEDMNADAPFSVAWAGEEKSKNWFHIAREYTEKWHHQQQIREAIGKQGIMTKELYYPLMDTFVRGLPHTYRNTQAENGTAVKVTIDTEIGGHWYLVRNNEKWEIAEAVPSNIAATIVIPPGIAWKLFTKGITYDEAARQVKVTGNEQLAKVTLTLLAVMA